MKKRLLLCTTVMITGLLLAGSSFSQAAETITSKTVTTSDAPISPAAIMDPRIAAQNFVAHINYARVALSMKNGDLARQHINQARSMIALITNATTEERRVALVEAGRVEYSFDTVHKYNYFPVEAEAVEIKTVSDGPIWAKNSLAVSDAEIVTLSLDLTNDKAEAYLAQAETDIAAGNLTNAEAKLGELTDAVVTVDDKVSLPLNKARDNIGIARQFLIAKNYDGARYALGHADDALDEMQKDDMYKMHLTALIAMRQEVKAMRDVATKKDPTLFQQSAAKLDKWTAELKSWAKK